VSALKEAARRELAADQPARLGEAFAPSLAVPAFDAARPVDGREIGTAYHRFLEHCDPAALQTAADVRGQCAALVAQGRLTAAQADFLQADDIEWFAQTAPAQLWRTHAAATQREVPFVYALPCGVAGESTIVRGVIDCLIETPGGLVLLDYKTDQPTSPADWEARLAGYRVQLQLYAAAAAAAFGRPVVQGWLVFVRARQLVSVPPEALDAREWLAATRPTG
jgi:ATP-dependent helicase/nuclease subunit A